MARSRSAPSSPVRSRRRIARCSRSSIPARSGVVANFKETQLGKIHPGQNVKIKIDGFDDATLHGTVDSIQAGTGSRFSLLPPDNASGNFTKVTQRVPVKILLPDHAREGLRPGMSADVTVYTE